MNNLQYPQIFSKDKLPNKSLLDEKSSENCSEFQPASYLLCVDMWNTVICCIFAFNPSHTPWADDNVQWSRERNTTSFTEKSSNERESADKGSLFALCVVVHCASSQHRCEREREKIVAGWKSSSWDRFWQQSSVSTERCDCYHTNVERVSRLLNFNQFFTSRLVYEWKFVFFLVLVVSSSCR